MGRGAERAAVSGPQTYTGMGCVERALAGAETLRKDISSLGDTAGRGLSHFSSTLPSLAALDSGNLIGS